MTTCYWTRMRNETRGAVNKKQQKHQFISMLFNKRGSFQKTIIYYCMIFNLCAYWNETRGTVIKKKNPIYYSMIFSLCAYWNETRWTDCKKIQLMTICYWTCVRNETRGAVFKKQQFITVCYSTCVRIEMKQEMQFSKKSNWWQHATELVCEMKQEGQLTKNNKNTNLLVCYSTRGAVFKKQ